MTAVWIVVAIIVALLLYLILSYNKLVRLRNEVDQGFPRSTCSSSAAPT